MRVRSLLAICAIVVAVIALRLAPAAAFSIDDVIYIDMARAMARQGSLFVAANGGVEGAPVLAKNLTVVVDGKAAPQYPSGYAYIAAPFYAAFGVSGLILLNALSGIAALVLTYSIANRLYGDRKTALGAAAILAFGGYWPNYLFGVWPHMLALAIVLGGVRLALAALGEPSGRRSLALAMAGAVLGSGVSVRIDIILALISIFFWLRFFATPARRSDAIVLAMGAAPGLMLAALLNDAKFGLLTPFTYGQSGGFVGLGQYAAAIAVAGAAVICALAIDVSRLRVAAFIVRRRREALAAAAIATLCALLADEDSRTYFQSLFVLVFDLQALPDTRFQPGLVRDEFGQIAYWGLPKKALLQSLPYAALLIIPLAGFFAGKRVKAASLLLALMCAPIAFYGLNFWHGGMSYNMRYFLPCLPFIAILTASTLNDLRRSLPPTALRHGLFAVGLGAFGGLTFTTLGEAVDAQWRTPLALYPQLTLAAALAVAAILSVFGDRARSARAAFALGLAAIGYAGALGLNDEIRYEGERAARLSLDAAHENALRPGDLVVTPAVESFVRAQSRGVAVFHLTRGREGDAAEAARAFANSGRCVLGHGSKAIAALGAVNPARRVSLAGNPAPTIAFAAFGDCAGRPAIEPLP